MPDLMSLNANDLPENHDLKSHGEKPLVDFKLDKNILEISYIFPGIVVSEQDRKVADNYLRETMPAKLHEVGISGTGFFFRERQTAAAVFRTVCPNSAGLQF